MAHRAPETCVRGPEAFARPTTEAAMSRAAVLLHMVLAVLADIGDRSVEHRIARFAEDPDPVISRAAKEALKLLRAATGA
jgi:hypothetical protein